MEKDYPVTGTPGPEHTQLSEFSPCEGTSWEKKKKHKGSLHGSQNLLWVFRPQSALNLARWSDHRCDKDKQQQGSSRGEHTWERAGSSGAWM